MELTPGGISSRRAPLPEEVGVIRNVCLKLPSGITLGLGECGTAALTSLIAGLAGKEVAC